MCDFTPQEFRDYFPIFADATDQQIEDAKALALLEVCEAVFGDACLHALRLLTAHHLSLYYALSGATGSGTGGGSSTGQCADTVTLAGTRISSETVSGVGSVSYDTGALSSLNSSAISAAYGQTPFGVQFHALLRRNTVGFGVGSVSGGGCGCHGQV